MATEIDHNTIWSGWCCYRIQMRPLVPRSFAHRRYARSIYILLRAQCEKLYTSSATVRPVEGLVTTHIDENLLPSQLIQCPLFTPFVGDILLADVIENDAWRLWESGDPSKMKDWQLYQTMFENNEITDANLAIVRQNYVWVAEKSEVISLRCNYIRIKILVTHFANMD